MGILRKETPERLKYLKLKAEAEKNDSNPTVAYELGICYTNGSGADKDLKRSFGAYIKSAERDYAIAQFRVGQCYSDGEGAPKDENKAMEWYAKSAQQNCFEGKEALNRLLATAKSSEKRSKLSKQLVAQNSFADEEMVVATLKNGGKTGNSVFKVKLKFNKIKIKKVYCNSAEYDCGGAVVIELENLFVESNPEKKFFLECFDHSPSNLTIYFEFCEISMLSYYENTPKRLPEGKEKFLLTALQSQIIPALKFLHDQRICHNDIKANNILGKLDWFYIWKITDFDHSVKFDEKFKEPVT
jgi:serine/threonine protein kinase